MKRPLNRALGKLFLVFLLCILGFRFPIPSSGNPESRRLETAAATKTDFLALSGAALSEGAASLETSTASAPRRVTIGVYLQNANDVDVKSSSYMMDFYLWFRWKGEIDPTETFEFSNLLDTWSMTKTSVYAAPLSLADGTKYQVFHVQGKFNRKFDLSRYPLDQQDLVVEVEDTRYHTSDLIYIPDTQSTNFSRQLRLPGWEITSCSARSETSAYESDFGYPESGHLEKYNRFIFELRINRPAGAYLFRMLLPIILVLMAGFSTFFYSPQYVDTRTNIAITVFLTMVALQLSVSSNLPEVGYLRLIDQIFNLGYFVTFLTLLESVIATHLFDTQRLEAARRLDHWTFFTVFVLEFFGIVWLI
ncbi:MAG: hypothetical protein WA705_24285 [Candidatus Ozemobacteraceae bacterium]